MALVSNEFEQALVDATQGRPGAARLFYELLLEATFFVPISSDEEPKSSAAKDGADRYLTVEHRGQRVIPVFTDATFIEQWCGQVVPMVQKPFRALMFTIEDDAWLHLNPAQEYGKEISDWELSLLREAGAEAIPEILTEVTGEEPVAAEILSGEEIYNSLRTKLILVLEGYPRVEVAFLFALREDEQSQPEPVLALRHKGLSEGEFGRLKQELEDIFRLSAEREENLLVLDLAHASSRPYHSLVEEIAPFYVSGSDGTGFIGRIFRLIKPKSIPNA